MVLSENIQSLFGHTTCTFCKKTGHNYKNCTDPERATVVRGLEFSISLRYNAFSMKKIRDFLQVQPYVYIQILSIHNQLNPRTQKGFLIESLVTIYHIKHRNERLAELGKTIYECLLSTQSEPHDNSFWNHETDFRLDQLDQILHTYLINEINRIEEVSSLSVVAKLNLVSQMLNGLYSLLYYDNNNREDRYIEFLPIVYEKIMSILHVLRSQFMGHLRTPEPEPTPIHTITPYVLITAKSRKTLSCPVCLENIAKNDQIELKCKHAICNPCLRQYVNSLQGLPPRCVLCRDTIHEIYTTNRSVYYEWDSVSST